VKVITVNDILEINNFEKKKKKKPLVVKDFLIIENYLYYSRDGKSLLFDSKEKRSVKTLPHVASRVTKHRENSKNSYENEKDFFINEERVWMRLLFWPQRHSRIFTED